MSRPVVGIYATAVPASWGPWHDRPSVVAPAALGAAVQQAGGLVVLLAPDPDLDYDELLGTLDALIVFDDAEHLDALREAARQAGLAVRVLDRARLAPDAPAADYAREIAGLLDAA
jgi:hypothetical protein